MATIILEPHAGLLVSSRLPTLTEHDKAATASEVSLLLALGACSAVAVALPDFHLRVPGHAILRAVLPAALGLALVPRRMGGSTLAAGALAAAGLLRFGGFGMGVGAVTSLILVGPLLDLALWRASPGWRLYLAFVLAGMGANLVALVARGAFKAVAGGGRPFAEWWSAAAFSYPLCGAVAGLVSAAIWFRLRESREATP